MLGREAPRRRPSRVRALAAVLAPVALVGAVAAARSPAPAAAFDPSGALAAYRRPASIPFPEANPHTPAREKLGRTLFFDPRLSRSGIMACATCHNPGFAWSDGLPRAVGHGMKELRRRTPAIANLAWGELFFWDGRAASLEEQALGPITSSDEMNLPPEELLRRLGGVAEYAALFEAAYPGEGITLDTIGKAIATFERTIVSGTAPFDRWVAGDPSAVSEPAQRGFALFETKARCSVCHAGWRFTDDSFHDLGVAGEDLGRGGVLEGIESVRFAFKTPSLRDVTRRAPYMHDGSEPTLAEVIELYALGGRVERPSLSHEIRPVDLDARERADLVAFLESLASDEAPVPIPRLPR
jgi:cytochrome c peroxidase